MEISQLRNVGLTKGEIKVYKALLKLGESTRTELAKISGISPSKIYDVANRLIEKGIISKVKKNNVIHFIASNPKNLKEIINKKLKEIEQEKKLVDELLPELLNQYNKSEKESDVEVFYNWKGLKTVFFELTETLKKGDTNYIFGASEGYNSEQADIFFSQHYERVKKAGFKVKIIFNEKVRQNKKRVSYYEKNKLHEVKYLNQETYTELNFYKDTVLIIMLVSNPIAIKIKNKEAVESFKQFFNTLWKQAKK